MVLHSSKSNNSTVNISKVQSHVFTNLLKQIPVIQVT